MTDVWEFARVQGEERHDHPTPKPVEMVERAIKSSAEAGTIVYDPFCGSGPVPVACVRQDRTAYCFEIDPGYTAVILERMAEMGFEPSLEA